MTVRGEADVTLLHATGRVVLIAAAVATLAMAGGDVTMPSAPAEWPAWVAQQDPITVLFAGIRLVALFSGGYVLAITAGGVALMVIRPAALHRFVQRATVPAARGLVQSVLGLTVAAVTSLPHSAVAHAADAHTVHLGAAQTPRPAPPGAPAPSPALPVEAAQAGLVNHRDTAPAGRAPQQWRVRAGDHFWAIAQHHLEAHDGRRPTDAATARYWRRLVERNRERLADPANPDLLFVGQVVELPPIGPKG